MTDRPTPHRCSWCRSKITEDSAIPIEGGAWACKPVCRELEEERIQIGESKSSAQRRRAAVARAMRA